MRDAFDELPSGPIGRCRCIPFPPVNEDHLLDALNYSIKHMEEHIMNEPDYYAGNGLSPIGAFQRGLISQEELIGFYKGNIIKYVVRAGKKESAVEDLLKAKSYINFYLDLFLMPTEKEEELEKEQTEIFKALKGLDDMEDEDVKED